MSIAALPQRRKKDRDGVSFVAVLFSGLVLTTLSLLLTWAAVTAFRGIFGL